VARRNLNPKSLEEAITCANREEHEASVRAFCAESIPQQSTALFLILGIVRFKIGV
jgi:hypothetical protein